MRKTLVQISGGFDSLAAAILELRAGWECWGLFIDYGQPYVKHERAAAWEVHKWLCAKYPLQWKSCTHRHVDLEIGSTSEVKAYIPMRNMVITAMSVNAAAAIKCEAVTVGSKSALHRPDDKYSFCDSTSTFYMTMQNALREGREAGMLPHSIRMPLVFADGEIKSSHYADCWTKERVLKLIQDEGIPLDLLWNCYGAGPSPCGECYHCVELKKAKAILSA